MKRPGMRFWTAVALALACGHPCVGGGGVDAGSAAGPLAGDLGKVRLQIEYRGSAAPATGLVLRTRDSRQQLMASAVAPDGSITDVTRKVAWTVEPSGLVTFDPLGRVMPRVDGAGTIRARLTSGVEASLPVTVAEVDRELPTHFANQIVPILTKTGCNGGGCHGKAAGQNGFRLSLLGFEPSEDYEHLVMEARGRRLFPAAPERSLLLQKGAAILPHGGGKRLEPDSDDWRLLIRWISQGMPAGSAQAATVTRIEVHPAERTLPLGGEQQLVVTAHYSDGGVEDVTRSSLYEANDKDIAACDERGLVRAHQQPGEVAVMVRYQGKVGVFRGTVPLGAPIGEIPVARNFVDEHLGRQWRKVGMPPSAVCDDSEFLRRVTLDVAGRLPTAAEISAYEAAAWAERKAKDGSVPYAARDAVIERLLGSTDYADYFANKWSALLRNKRTDPKHARGSYAFHGWVRDNLNANRPYDEWVREILGAAGDIVENPPVAWFRQVTSMTAQIEDSAQLFLGQRLQCAQCHHHPYERWSQNDYWSFGAFFSQVGRKPGSQPGEEVIFHKRGAAQAVNKKNNQSLKPAGLGEAMPPIAPDDDPRLSLAAWMTGPRNPWFAKALVNRYWKHFFGRGLVDPEDDMRDTNPATNPALLDALADDFVRSGFDLKHLVGTLVKSSAYQLSSVPNPYNARDRHHFSRFYPRRLPAEVLLDAVNTVSASENRFDGLPAGTRAVCLPDNSFNASSYFLTVFGRPESSSACECERSMDASLSQSLHLLNSKDIQAKITAEQGRAALLAGDGREDAAKFRDLYRLAFARDPRPDEVEVAKGYLSKKLASAADEAAKVRLRREAFEDTVWAVLNTKEFLFNH